MKGFDSLVKYNIIKRRGERELTELRTLICMRIIIYNIIPAAKNVYPFFETNNVLGEIVTISSSLPREETDF